jgi:hypothetical protein
MVRDGTARKIGTKKGKRHWVLVEPVHPSNADRDTCALKTRDMHVVVGLSLIRFRRIISFRASGTVWPARKATKMERWFPGT